MKTEDQLTKEANEVRRLGGIVWKKDSEYLYDINNLSGYVNGVLEFGIYNHGDTLIAQPLWSKERRWRICWGRNSKYSKFYWYLTKEAAIHAAEMIYLYRWKGGD